MEDNIRKYATFFLEFAAMFLLYAVMDSTGIEKYVILTIAGVFLILVNGKKQFEFCGYGYLLLPVILYCGMGLLLSVCGGTMTAWTVKTVSFWILPPVFVYILGMAYDCDRARMVDMQFYGAVGMYCVVNRTPLLYWYSYESVFAFVFGLFVLYYAYRHRWLCMLAAAYLMDFCDKRIALLAVGACLGLMLVLRLLKYCRKCVYLFWGLWSAAVGCYLYSIRSGLFAQLCERFQIDTSTRIDIYTQIAAVIPEKYYVGKGLGTANELLSTILTEDLFSQWYNNPHNDFLKIYVELGIVGLALFLLSYFAVFYLVGKRMEQRAFCQLFVILLYFMLLMTTDNVSIYIIFLVPMYSVCMALLGNSSAIT